MPSGLRVGVVGATGAVGRVTLALLRERGYENVRANRIRDALDRGTIVLVAGSQGVSTDAEVTTLGREGSDATAVALATALGAELREEVSDA